jgi:hypothetical protein
MEKKKGLIEKEYLEMQSALYVTQEKNTNVAAVKLLTN